MAISAVNLTYLNGPQNGVNSVAAQGQVLGTNNGGPSSSIQYGLGTAILDGSSTTFTLNWIDGVQKPFQRQIFVQLLSVAAPATINGVANQAVYSGVGSFGQFRIGQSVVFAGFTNSGNNGTFVITAINTSAIQVTNSSSVAETNPAGTASVTVGPFLAAAFGGRALYGPAFPDVADTAANSITATFSAYTQTGCTVTLSAAGSAAQTLSVWAELIPTIA